MSLSIPDPIPIEPLTQERPRGSPCGAQAYTTRLTAESFEAIKTALLVQERARTIERDLSAKKGVPWATSKNEKHVVQLVVDENGKTVSLSSFCFDPSSFGRHSINSNRLRPNSLW
jgi:hypothetical protein